MKQSLSRAALAAALVLGAAAAAGAQSSPPPAPSAPAAPAAPPDPNEIRREIRVRFAAPDGARALARAYHAIGEAEALNSRSPFVGQARAHYAGAYARYRRGDAAGAAAEASAAAALARAALDERPPYVPRGLEAPPTPAPRVRAAVRPPTAPAPPNAPPAAVYPPGLPDLGRLQEIVRLPQVLMRHRYDASSLQALVALENTPEVRGLADRAGAAAASAQRARAANDRAGAQRQERLADDLAAAVRGITAADHPGRLPRRAPGAPRAAGVLGLRDLDIDLSDLDPSGFDLLDATRFELPDDLMDGLRAP